MDTPLATPPAPAVRSRSDQLNRECLCVALDRDKLCAALQREWGDRESCTALLADRPHLFADAAMFVAHGDLERMQATVAAVEAAAQLPGYRAAVLARATDIACHDFGPAGAFMGYDFHLGGDGPRLIEVNTNAGGAFLNAILAQAASGCCGADPGTAPAAFEGAVAAMFRAEWRAQRATGTLQRIAIVDDRPAEQYLFPEFLVAQRMLARAGIAAVVVDAAALTYRDGRLLAEGAPVDLVYNRLVDFALEAPEHAALRDAYRDGAVVVTPNPHVHALYADKRNLVQLSDPVQLRQWGLAPEHLAGIAQIPHTLAVTDHNADVLWDNRKHLFFKPAGGYGGRAVYRGDRVTRGVWSTIRKGGYVAQTLAVPGERLVSVDGAATARKADLRVYTYRGEVLLTAARLYQGQTTNFRTPGGGFAPVFLV